MSRPEDITDDEYDMLYEYVDASDDGESEVFRRLIDYVVALEAYADTLEAQLALESRQPTVEPEGTRDDIAALKQQIAGLTSELASAQARLFSIGLLTR